MNKTLALGLIIFFILVIAGGAIWLAVRPAPEAEEPERGLLQRFPFGIFGGGEEEPAPTETEPITLLEPESLLLLESGPVESFAVKENGVRYILKQNGHVFEIGPRGEEQTRISNTTIPGIFEAFWSPDTKQILLKYIENGSVRTISAEFVATSTRATTLPLNIISSAFSPNRERLVYLIPAGAGSRLIAADYDNASQAEVATFPFRDFEVFWPETNFVYLLSRPSALAEGALFSLNIQTGAFDKILSAPGLQVKFSDNGGKIVYSSYDASSERPLLFVYDTESGETALLQSVELADKCAFASGNKIYCGLPQDISLGLWPDDWLKGNISTADTLWEIDLATGARRQLNEQTFNIKQITASEDGSYIYFIDKNNGSLWSLRIRL